MTNNPERADAYNEILEILNYLPKEDYNKVPKEKIEVFKKYSNKDHNFKYDPDKTLDEQNVLKTTKVLYGILFRDYWATERQREIILKKQNADKIAMEEEKKKKYSYDNLFKNRNEKLEENKNEASNEVNNNVEEMQLIEIKEEPWYKKIASFFKGIFKK